MPERPRGEAGQAPVLKADAPIPAGASLADALGNACFCVTLDPQRLQDTLMAELGSQGSSASPDWGWAHAFARRPVFISLGDTQRMVEVIRAIESVVALPAWQDQVLLDAPAIARHAPPGAGVFYGYDFHLSGGSFGLIEINTNAGGALMNTALARAQQECCSTIAGMQPSPADAERFEREIVEMFRSEWSRLRSDRPLASVAIVDSAPASQFLYPEFQLFQRLLSRHGIRAVIADPAELSFTGGALRCGSLVIDLVYNRLTDFYFETAACAALRDAYLHDAAVVTPHPRGHAMYADKRRLIALTDSATLEGLGVAEPVRQVLLQGIPRTVRVQRSNADDLWARRRTLFFKPFGGYGGRAAYRGDKLTRRVWDEILAGDYIAQAVVAPGTRPTGPDPSDPSMKFDLRQFVYRGAVQWTAARMYQGQTTNFRTPGGGFAPVYVIRPPDAPPPDPGGGEDPASASHSSHVFLLGEAGDIHPLPHALYVALARGEAESPSLAGRTLRIADWYVRRSGDARELVSEWYGWAGFDGSGRFNPTPQAAPGNPAPQGRANIQPSAFPTQVERSRMLAMLEMPAPAPSR